MCRPQLRGRTRARDFLLQQQRLEELGAEKGHAHGEWGHEGGYAGFDEDDHGALS